MLRTLKDFQKCAIGASDGDIGHVKDLYFDDDAWAIRYLVVDTGAWLPGRKVLISPISIQAADWSAHRLPAALTREQVKHSPDIDTDQPVSRQHEVEYLGYYGFLNYWGGAGMWGDGMVPMAMYPGYVPLPGESLERERVIEASADAERARHRDDDPHLRSCDTIVGYHLHASDGEVGHVDGFLVDEQTWAVRYLVINTSNWWLGHQVLIAPQWISGVDWSDRSVTVDLSRESVKLAPAYDPSLVLDRPTEAGLHTHYGRAPYWLAGTPNKRAP